MSSPGPRRASARLAGMGGRSHAERAHERAVEVLDEMSSRRRRIARAQRHPERPCYICGAQPDTDGLVTHDRESHGAAGLAR